MSFLKRLFGGGDKPPATPETGPAIEHAGYRILATPIPEGGQWRLSGLIEKTVDGETREHRFIRVDLFASREEAAEASLRKGRQLVDQEKDGVFAKRG